MASEPPSHRGYHDHLLPSESRTGSLSGMPQVATHYQPRRSDASSLQSNSSGVSMAPTWHGFIHTTYDALIILEACLSGILHHIPRRPHDRERPNIITSGNVFIYEENASGIKRWTDGVTWSPSRIMGNFLVYRELSEPFPAGEKKKAKKRKRGSEDPETVENVNVQSEEDRKLVGSLVDSYGFKPNGLIKKTLNVKVNNVNHHIVSYYNLEDVKTGNYRRPEFDVNLQGITPRQEILNYQFKVSCIDPDEDRAQHILDPFGKVGAVMPPQNPSIHHGVDHVSQPPMQAYTNEQALMPQVPDASINPMTTVISQSSQTTIPAQYNPLHYSYSDFPQPSSQYLSQDIVDSIRPQDNRHESVQTHQYFKSELDDYSELPTSFSGGDMSSLPSLTHSQSLDHGTGMFQMHNASPSLQFLNTQEWLELSEPPARGPKRRQTAPGVTSFVNSASPATEMAMRLQQQQQYYSAQLGGTYA